MDSLAHDSDDAKQNFSDELLSVSDNEIDDIASDSCSCSCANDAYNRQLQMRILSLRETMHVLKTQLQDEKEIWRREMEERRENDYINRATEIGLQYYGVASTADIKYQDQLLQSHYEHRQNLQKQIAMSNYKRRLLEVENMCNLELLRVKQSVQILQPLQVMCSEWKFPDESGDSHNVKELDEKLQLKDESEVEVAMPLELIAQKVDNLATVQNIPLDMSKSQPNMNDQS